MIIKGKDLIFYIKIGNVNYPLCHAKTCSINTTAGTLPTTTLGSGRGETNNYSGKYNYTIKGDGITYIGDQVDNFTLQTAQTSFNKINWTFTDASNLQWSGVALVTSTTFDSAFDAVSTFQNELLGDGEYTFIKATIHPIPPLNDAVTIQDQFGNPIATVQAPGTYTVTMFDTIDLRSFNPFTGLAIPPDITITQSIL
jgi:predicted secreted protein